MKKVNYTFPVKISIQPNFHDIIQKVFQEHFIERTSTSLSAAERAIKTQPVLYANDLANLINQISYRLKRQKGYKKDLVELLKKYRFLPNQDIPIQSITQLTREKLNEVKDTLEDQRITFEFLDLMMRDEPISPQRKKEMIQRINPHEGRVLFEFFDYFQNKNIKINSRKVINFMSSLSKFSEITQVKYHFNTLNQKQQKFLQPICSIYEQYVNNQQQIQSQMTQKKLSIIPSLFGFNKAKAVKQELIIKRGPEMRELKSPYKQQPHDYQLNIKKLQSEIDQYKRKDKQYAKLHEQNERYRSQIQRLKFSMVSQEEQEQQQRKHYELMIPFQAVSKQMQAELAFYKQELEITKVRLQKWQEQAKQGDNISDELQYLRQNNKNLTKQSEKLVNQNYVLRLNEAKYKKNFPRLQTLLRQLEQEQKLMQGQLQSLKQKVQSSQHPTIIPQPQQQNGQNIEEQPIQDVLNDPSDQIHELSEQNTRLKDQISLSQHKLARLLQNSQLMATSRQQKITALQLKILSLTQQLTRPQE